MLKLSLSGQEVTPQCLACCACINPENPQFRPQKTDWNEDAQSFVLWCEDRQHPSYAISRNVLTIVRAGTFYPPSPMESCGPMSSVSIEPEAVKIQRLALDSTGREQYRLHSHRLHPPLYHLVRAVQQHQLHFWRSVSITGVHIVYLQFLPSLPISSGYLSDTDLWFPSPTFGAFPIYTDDGTPPVNHPVSGLFDTPTRIKHCRSRSSEGN